MAKGTNHQTEREKKEYAAVLHVHDTPQKAMEMARAKFPDVQGISLTEIATGIFGVTIAPREQPERLAAYQQCAKPDVTVYDIGTQVKIGPVNEEISAVIAGIKVSNGGQVEYFVIWWAGRERKSEWLNCFEVVANAEPKVRIGFHG